MAWMAAAAIAAPLIGQGISAITGIFQSRKAKKLQKKQLEGMNAQLAQMKAQTMGMTQSMMGNFMGPSGINAGVNGVPLMGRGQLPQGF